MALVRTNHVGALAAEGQPGTASFTTSAFTTSSNSLLVAGYHAMQHNASTSILSSMTISSSPALTWTSRVSAEVLSAFSLGTIIYTAPVTSGASTTVTIDCGAIDLWVGGVAVVGYTGYDTTTPTGGTGTFSLGSGADGAHSLTLSAAPTTDDEVVGFVSIDKETLGTTPGSAFSEQYDVQAGASGGYELETRTASTSTTVDWVDLHTGTGAIFRACACGLVIKAAAAASGKQPPIIRRPHSGLILRGRR